MLARAESAKSTPRRTKLELAQALMTTVLRAGLSFEYLTFDSWYNARPLVHEVAE